MNRKQQQPVGKGQYGRHASMVDPIRSIQRDPKQGHPAALKVAASRIAEDQWTLPGSCCCAGPVRDRHGRRFTTFPPWR